MPKELPVFLADTLWYGMTSRISFQTLKEYAQTRINQGFNAVQVVVGIPPEVGPLNRNASGAGGPGWDLKGNFNTAYLDECEKRVQMLNEAGLLVVLYGAWGHQVDWIGTSGMTSWWDELIKRFEKYDVIFCLCGESNLWAENPNKLLPDKSTLDFVVKNKLIKVSKLFPFNKIINYYKPVRNKLLSIFRPSHKPSQLLEKRKNAWSVIAEHVAGKTCKPLLIHTLNSETSNNAINNPYVLDAVTTQTGHSKSTRNRHWSIPTQLLSNAPDVKYINLEPWYEGILDQFYLEDQLYAYWATMLAGAHAYCYGAHGIWNCGDGKFLSQWGKQTFDEAMNLSTPELIGKSHRFFLSSGAMNYPFAEVNVKDGQLIYIRRKDEQGNSIIFFPEYEPLELNLEIHQYFDPIKGVIVSRPDKAEPIVIMGNLK